MVDIAVAIEKLQSFEVADDLAEFFRGYGIKAQPRNSKACAIAKFVSMETGLSGIATNSMSTRVTNEEGETLDSYCHSGAMADFIERYDKGFYPDLVEEGYELYLRIN